MVKPESVRRREFPLVAVGQSLGRTYETTGGGGSGWSGPERAGRAGPSLGRPRPTNADSRHPRVTTPTPLWPGAPEMICDTGNAMPKPGD